MASRRFFGYDPYDYYYTAAPYNYPYDYDAYYQPQPAPSRRSRGVFAGAAPAAAKPARRAWDTKTSFSIPVHGPDSDPEPEPEPKQERKAAPTAGARAQPVAPAMSAEQATVRMQAAARGLLARKSVRVVREVERETEQVVAKVASEAEALIADPRARVAVGEALMRMLLRLDAVRGSREYRRRITKRVLALQDAVDALETKPSPVVREEAEADVPDAMAIEMEEEEEEESAVAPELADAAERTIVMEIIKTAVHTPHQMEENEGIISVDEPEQEGEEKEAVPGDANADVDDEPDGSDAEGEWEMVAEENEAPVAATSDDQDQRPPRKEPACPLEKALTASTGGVDMKKVMELVAALYEQSTQQLAVISVLVERVDALERTVRRMEDAESRRRRAKKLSAEDK